MWLKPFKSSGEALPAGMEELPATALTEPTHIVFTSLISAALALAPPCVINAHTRSVMKGAPAPHSTCTRSHSDSCYLCCLRKQASHRELTNAHCKCLSASWGTNAEGTITPEIPNQGEDESDERNTSLKCFHDLGGKMWRCYKTNTYSLSFSFHTFCTKQPLEQHKPRKCLSQNRVPLFADIIGQY